MTPKLPNILDYVKEEDLILSSERSHAGLDVPQIITEYGSIKDKFRDDRTSLPLLLRSLFEAKKSYRKLEVHLTEKKEIDSETLEELKKYMISLNILDIGFTVVPRHFIFKGKGILYPNAIVITMEMEKNKISTAPSSIASKEIFRTYKELGVIVNKTAKFLKARGYNAQAGPALGGDVSYPMLAEKAGLGCIGKHGLLITPSSGPSLRIAAVYTDIENLPYTDHTEHLWIKDFCDSCNLCVKKCPAQAIYKESKILSDGSKVCIDYKKCAVPFSNDHGCTLCVKSCTFFKGNYDKIKENSCESI